MNKLIKFTVQLTALVLLVCLMFVSIIKSLEIGLNFHFKLYDIVELVENADKINAFIDTVNP